MKSRGSPAERIRIVGLLQSRLVTWEDVT